MTLKKKVFENIVGNGENAGNHHFLLFTQCFLHYQGQKSSFQLHLLCHLQINGQVNLDKSKILLFGIELTGLKKNPFLLFLGCFLTNHVSHIHFAIACWLVVLGLNATLTATVISWRPVTHICFLAFPVLTQLFFPKTLTTFLTCFCRGKRRKYAGKKSRLNRGSNSQPPGHEFDTFTTEPPGQGYFVIGKCH